MMVVGPALELHFSHQLGLDPARRRVQLRLFGERTGLPLQRLEQRLRPLDRPVAEARADVRGVPQLVSLPISEEQRAGRRARTLALRVPADYQGRAVRGLDLAPRRGAPASRIGAVLALFY